MASIKYKDNNQWKSFSISPVSKLSDLLDDLGENPQHTHSQYATKEDFNSYVPAKKVVTSTSLSGMDATADIIYAQLSSASDISFSNDFQTGHDLTIIIKNINSSSITIPLPTEIPGWICLDGDTIDIDSGKYGEISIIKYTDTEYSISCKVQL